MSDESAPIVTSLYGRARFCRDRGEIKTPDLLERAADKIEGLEADLDNAIEVAFNRGATEWVRLNYPGAFQALGFSSMTGTDRQVLLLTILLISGYITHCMWMGIV